jgi:hypothetical protein
MLTQRNTGFPRNKNGTFPKTTITPAYGKTILKDKQEMLRLQAPKCDLKLDAKAVTHYA